MKKYCGECNNCHRRMAVCRKYGEKLDVVHINDGDFSRDMLLRLKKCLSDNEVSLVLLEDSVTMQKSKPQEGSII